MKLWFDKGVWVSKHAARKVADVSAMRVESIAVLLHYALGDMVLARPFLVSLKQFFPDAAITVGVIENYMNGIPTDLADRVHVAAGRYTPRPPLREQFRSWKALGPHDLIFDLSGFNTSFWVTVLNEAKLKVGFTYFFHHRFLYDVAVARSDFHFVSQNYLDQLNVLGLTHDWPPPYRYPLTAPEPERPYVVYFPTASHPRKCWPPEHWGELLAAMAEAYPALEHVVLFGRDPWEVERGEQMVSAAALPNVRAEPKADLTQSAEILGRATMLIAADTGIRNLAIATDTPTLGIFVNNIPYKYWPRFGHHDIVFHPDAAPLPVKQVLAAARRLLDAIEDR